MDGIVRKPYLPKTLSITNLSNSSSDVFFLLSIIFKASSPTRYLTLGLADIAASKTMSATILGEEPFSNLG
jgi:hypothetical protein